MSGWPYRNVYLAGTDPAKFTANTFAALTLGVAFADLTTLIDVRGSQLLNLFTNIDINAGNTVQIRALCNYTTSAGAFELPILTTETAKVKVEPWVFEFTNDADQNIMLPVTLNGLISSIKFQAKQADTAAALTTTATIITAHLVKGWAQ